MWAPGKLPPRRFTAWLCAPALALTLLASLSCGGSGSSGGGAPATLDVELATAFAGLVFERPVKLVQHPDDPDRWYVVEQGGEILTFLASDPLNTLTSALDLAEDVELGPGSEQGLLSLAFDPDFDATDGGELYLAYTDEDEDEVVLARYESDDGGLTFTEQAVLLALDHPRENHNGGDLHFDREGNFLFWSVGDGGGAGDPDENGQNPQTLLGTLMRLDVRAVAPPGLPYAIPPGNPFTGNPSCWSGPGALPCPEIWAYGFRNPWRFTVDPLTGELWLGDVGQSTLEEIDFVIAGRNYGWDCREGNVDHEFVPPCNTTLLEEPEAVHPRGEARSITGGAVYRSSSIPGLGGHFVYGDFVTGNVWTLDTVGNPMPQLLDLPTHNIASFGQDADGEIYLVTFSAPSIYKLVPAP